MQIPSSKSQEPVALRIGQLLYQQPAVIFHSKKKSDTPSQGISKSGVS